jgi:NAD(P)H-hydrate epimerase
MARGGSGDVLAGLLCGLAAQGIYLGAAAAAAVYLHGRAGDLAARHGTQAGMAAMDIVRCLPEAFRDVTFR